MEALRFALYGQANWEMLGLTVLIGFGFLALAIWGYDPARGMLSRRPGGPPG